MTKQSEPNRTEQLTGRTCTGLLEALDLLTIYMGDRLGLYRALADGNPATAVQLADRADIDSRYAREWLEQQAVTGILDVEDPGAPESEMRFRLPPDHAAAFADEKSPFPVLAFAQTLVSVASVMPRLLEAFKTGGGVSWAEYGTDMIEAQGGFNRGWLLLELGTKYLPSIPDVHARLNSRSGARVADIACGVGWSSIAIARTYPEVRVVGYDLDAASIEQARRNAATEGVAERVTFEVADATRVAVAERFDVALIIEAVHDVARPVELLSGVRRMLKLGGTLIVADEKVAPMFSPPGDFMERFFYAASVLVCLPCGMSEQPSAQTGAVLRESKMAEFARRAGFSQFENLGLEHASMNFYRLKP